MRVENRKIFAEYQVFEKYQCGIELIGQEVKSALKGSFNLAGSFVVPKGNELYLVGATIPMWQPTNKYGEFDPKRSRRLLLKKTEIRHLIGKSKEKHLTIVPLSVYNNKNLVKVEIALARKMRKYEKKEKIKERELKREMARGLD